MKLIDDGNSDFDIGELKSSWPFTEKTPHCKEHGAMNKVSSDGMWRCIRAAGSKDCRAGCRW